jgi:hypothetical protein
MPEPTPGIALKRPAGRGHGKRGRWFDRAAGFGTLLVGSRLLALSPGDDCGQSFSRGRKAIWSRDCCKMPATAMPGCGWRSCRSTALCPPGKSRRPLMASLDLAPNLRGLWSTRTEYLLFYSTLLTSEELYEVRHQRRTIAPNGPTCDSRSYGPPSGPTA